jgi:hypothetical protein
MSVETSRPSGRTDRAASRPCRAALLALGCIGLGGIAAAALPPPGGGAPGGRPPAASGSPVIEGGELSILQGRAISLDEAIDMAQRRFNARVVRAEVAERGGRRTYVLRLLSADGRVFNVRVDAATGSMQ